MTTYTMHSPDIMTTGFYKDLQTQSHILIGGTTGSGKSNFLNGFIHSLLAQFPDEMQLVLIDPKMTALKKFRRLPHTITYAQTPEEMAKAIDTAHEEMQRRFKSLDNDDFLEEFNGSDIWIVIDEYFDFTNKVSRETIKKLEAIASLGRASKIHIIFCTQRPTRDIITGMIKANVTATVGLKTASPLESRNLLDSRGCEELLPKTQAFYRSATFGGDTFKIEIPYANPEELKRVIDHWKEQAN